MPSAGWPVSGDSSRKLAVRSENPQLALHAHARGQHGRAGRGGAGRVATDMAVMASRRAVLAARPGTGPAATAAAKDTDPRYPPTLCGHMLLKQAM